MELVLLCRQDGSDSFPDRIQGEEYMASSDESKETSSFGDLGLRKLTLEHIKHIDELLAAVGEYGEVRLIVQRGELRYINKVQSFKVWKSDTEK
jgi:hypothetical protein